MPEIEPEPYLRGPGSKPSTFMMAFSISEYEGKPLTLVVPVVVVPVVVVPVVVVPVPVVVVPGSVVSVVVVPGSAGGAPVPPVGVVEVVVVGSPTVPSTEVAGVVTGVMPGRGGAAGYGEDCVTVPEYGSFVSKPPTGYG